MFTNSQKNNKGFTIAELIIAVALLSFGVVMVYGSFYAIADTTYSLGPRFTASYLAQEGMEVVRNLRDNNIIGGAIWSAGLTGSPCNAGCKLDYKTESTTQLTPYDNAVFLGLNSDGFYSYDSGSTSTIYRRKITITTTSNPDILGVESLVTWTYKGQLLSFKLTEYLYNWQ